MTSIISPGLPLHEAPGGGEPITQLPTAVTAFVGRTLKGPVGEPLQVESFAAFQQIFGGLWQPSTLAYAVEQYFENGGRTAVIVRVINGARPASLTLPAGLHALTLCAVCPGTREYLRAAVDYDSIGEDDAQSFNLVVQRIRAPGSELVEDQEIFRRVTIEQASERCVADVLAGSRLVRVSGKLPSQRPDRTAPQPGGGFAGYVASNPNGDDGAPLTDYDLIGSSMHRNGLFALQTCRQFNFLCIPPPARDRDVGMSVLLVASRVCRERQALLLVDAPSGWTSPAIAHRGIREYPLRSHDAVMFFPRLLAFDRLRGRFEVFAASAAAVGLIARHDASAPIWTADDMDDPALRAGMRPAFAVDDLDRIRLAHAGVNSLQSVRSGARPALRTLANEAGSGAQWRFLAARRLALSIAASVERGTRWAVFERNDASLRSRVAAQVHLFLAGLEVDGAFQAQEGDEACFVVCDERLNTPTDVVEGRLRLLFGFATERPGEFHAVLLTHLPGASRMRPVSVNRLATAQRRVGQEIETQILRSLVAR